METKSRETMIKYDKEWKWPKLASLIDINHGGGQSQTSLFMTQDERRQCILIGSYYLSINISPDSTTKDNLKTFLTNLKAYMINSKTFEDYANDGNDMTFEKLNKMLKKEWWILEPLLFPSIQRKTAIKTKAMKIKTTTTDDEAKKTNATLRVPRQIKVTPPTTGTTDSDSVTTPRIPKDFPSITTTVPKLTSDTDSTSATAVTDTDSITITPTTVTTTQEETKKTETIDTIETIATDYHVTMTKDLAGYLFDMDDNGDEGDGKQEYKDEKLRKFHYSKILNDNLKLCAFKMGCFIQLFHCIKELGSGNNDNNDNNSIDDVLSIITRFTKYCNEFEIKNSPGGYKLLLSGVNKYDNVSKPNETLFDVINQVKNNDYLKRFFIGKYSNVYGESPIATNMKYDNYVSLSNDLLSNLKRLGLQNVRILMKQTKNETGDNYSYPQIVVLDTDNTGTARDLHSNSLLSINKYDLFQCLLIGCNNLANEKGDGDGSDGDNDMFDDIISSGKKTFGFGDNSDENVIELAIVLFGILKDVRVIFNDDDHYDHYDYDYNQDYAYDYHYAYSRRMHSRYIRPKRHALPNNDVLKKYKKLQKDILETGCYLYLNIILDENTDGHDQKDVYGNDINENSLASKFISYFDYLNFNSVNALFKKLKEQHRTKLLNFVSKKYFEKEELKIKQVMTNHCQYVNDMFEKINQVLSSFGNNGKQIAENLFWYFFQTLNDHSKHLNSVDRWESEPNECFADSMIESMKQRMKICDDNDDNNYPRLSIKNSQIINALYESQKTTQVVKNHLIEMYDESDSGSFHRWMYDPLDSIEKNCGKYFASKFITSRSDEQLKQLKSKLSKLSKSESNTTANINIINTSPTISNFVIMYAFQRSLCFQVYQTQNGMRMYTIHGKKKRDIPKKIANITPFFQSKLLDPCQLIRQSYNDDTYCTLYYFVALHNNEMILKLLSECVDSDILKYAIKSNDDYDWTVQTKSPLDAAINQGYWQMVKYISTVL